VLKYSILISLILPIAVTGKVTAQARPNLVAGARVRLQVVGGPREFLVGKLLLFETTALTVVPSGEMRARRFALAQLRRFEVSRGYHPAVVYGGPAIGAALGLWLGPVILTKEARCSFDIVVPDCMQETSDALIGAAVGGVVFLVATRLVARERWLEVPLAALSVGWLTTHRQLAVRWSFRR